MTALRSGEEKVSISQMEGSVMDKVCETCTYGKEADSSPGPEIPDALACFLNPPVLVHLDVSVQQGEKWQRPPVTLNDFCSHWSNKD